MTVGGVGNGVAKEDGCWDLKLGAAALQRGPRGPEVNREDHPVLKE